MKKYYGKLTYSEWKNGSGWQIQDAFAGVDDLETTDPANIKEWSKEDFINYLLNDYNALDGLTLEEIKELAAEEPETDTLYIWTCECFDDETDERSDENVYEVWKSALAKIYLSNLD